MKHSTLNILAIHLALAVIAASTLLIVGSIMRTRAQSSLASGISSVTDYYVPGSYPWGTAFDGSGRVWVAMPGCDLAPSCSSSTPPGKLALFDPNTHNWATIVSLPAGYGQPVFVAVDQSGKVWFTMPVTNAIGLYDPVSTNVTQWAVPTASSGISADKHGLIWLDDSLQNTFGSFPIGGGSFSFSPSPGSHPHDGLNVDSQNRIWFDEEFANKLAVAIPAGSPTPTTTATATLTNTPTSTPTPLPGDRKSVV